MCSKGVGFSEIFLKNNILSDLVVNDSEWYHILNKFENIKSEEMDVIKSELTDLRKKWLERDIINEFKLAKII